MRKVFAVIILLLSVLAAAASWVVGREAISWWDDPSAMGPAATVSTFVVIVGPLGLASYFLAMLALWLLRGRRRKPPSDP